MQGGPRPRGKRKLRAHRAVDHPARSCLRQPDRLLCLAKRRASRTGRLEPKERRQGNRHRHLALHSPFLRRRPCRFHRSSRKRRSLSSCWRPSWSVSWRWRRRRSSADTSFSGSGRSRRALRRPHCCQRCCSRSGTAMRVRQVSSPSGVMGLAFALVYLWRRSLVAPMVMHFLQDFIGIVLLPLLGMRS